MARRTSVRPRTLSLAFGLFLLFMAVIDWWSATSGWSASYRYAVDTSRWAYIAYMLVAAVLLSGVGIAALSGMRDLDRRIEAAEASADAEDASPVLEPAADPDAVPPPLAEDPAGPDDVDQDIDELLVSLEEIETSAEGETEVTETVVAEVPASDARRVVRKTLARTPANLERLKERRAALPAYYAGPALAAIGIIGICAAMLPGTDSMLQSSYQLNTMLLLGIGYAYAGVALFTALASWAMLRKK